MWCAVGFRREHAGVCLGSAAMSLGAPGPPKSSRAAVRPSALTAYLAISASLMSFSSLEFMLVEIQKDFAMSADSTMVVAQIASASCLVAVFLAGALADRVGNRRMLEWSSALFCLGALFVGVAPNVGVLVVGLSVAGIGTIVMSIVGLAVLNATYPDKAERAKAFGVFALIAPVVSIVVPLVVSAIIPLSSWRVVTALWIAVGLATSALARHSLRPIAHAEADAPSARSELVTPTLAGIALSATALAFSFFSVTGQVAERLDHGIISACIGVSAMVALVVVMVRMKAPTLDVRTLRRRGSFPILAALFLVNGVNLFFFTYLLLQYRFHQTLFETAVLLIVPQVTASLGALAGGQLSAKWGSWRVATGALVLAAVGSTGTLVFGAESSAWVAVLILSIAAVPIAGAVGPLTQSFMDLAPSDGTGAASSIRNASVNLGIAIAGLITGTIVFDELDRDTSLTIEAYTQQAEAFRLAGAMCVIAYIVAAGFVVLHARRRVPAALKEGAVRR